MSSIIHTTIQTIITKNMNTTAIIICQFEPLESKDDLAYLLISCNNNNMVADLCLLYHVWSGCMRHASIAERAYYFFTLLAILGRAACWCGVLFIENQYFPFLRMQNELLLRWALWRDWRLSLSRHSSEDFHKDIYFFSLGVNSANMDLPFSQHCQGTYHPPSWRLYLTAAARKSNTCWYLNKQTAWILQFGH